MDRFSSYNKIFLIYKYPQYIHVDKQNNFITVNTSSLHYNINDYTIVQNLYNYNKQNVHFYYHHILKSLEQKNRNKNEALFMNIQRFKLAFSRFIHIVKLKFKKHYNTNNLLFQTLKNPIKICENNCVYFFDDIELYRLIENCFNYEEYNIPTILKLKNPYTNIPFKLHNIIHIYFELLKRGKNSLYFTMYFKNNFSEEHMMENYEINIFINCLNKKFDGLKYRTKIFMMYQMFDDFPKYTHFRNVNIDILIKLFWNIIKPFYVYTKLTENTDISEDSQMVLNYKNKAKDRLKQIYKCNPCFGRKIMTKTLTSKYITSINESIFTLY